MRQHTGDDDRGDTPATDRSVLVPVAPSATLRETVEYVVDSTLTGEADSVTGDAADSVTGDAADSAPGDAADSALENEADSASADEIADDRSGEQPTDGSVESVTDDPEVPTIETDDGAARPVVHFVYVHAPEEFDPAEDAPGLDDAEALLDRVRVWAEEDASGEDRIDVRTGHLGTDRYLFSPADVAASLIDAARERDVDRIVLDPEYDPGIGAPLLRPLEYELSRDASLTIEEAPVQSRVRRAPLVGRSSARRIGALAGLSFLFYQVLAGAITPFDVVTGAITAVVVALTLSRISFGRDPTLAETPLRLGRTALYVPYLLWQIVVSNVVVASVILNPWKEIDPKMTRIEPAVYGALPVTSLANSITLTPGTLTVRVQGRELLIHTLLPGAREDLFDGSLERAIRFVFYGRRAMRIDSLRERGVAEIVPIGGSGDGATEGGDGS